MPLTFEERERRAYADGRLQEAAVLREAVDVTDDRIGELERRRVDGATHGCVRVHVVIRERDVEAYLHTRVSALGGVHRRCAWLGRAGAPDDRVMLPGNCFWAECKAPGKKPTAAQTREHDLMRSLGETVYVFTCFADIDAVLK